MSKLLPWPHYENQAKNLHGDIYDYSLVSETFKNCRSYIKIICKRCKGLFVQKVSVHCKQTGCPKCAQANNRTNNLPWPGYKLKLIKTHGDRYDYSLCEEAYDNSLSKLPIICREHGVFQMLATNHRRGYGCPSCSSSLGEDRVRQFLNEMKVSFQKEKPISNQKGRWPLRFDFYLSNHNIAIEFDGKQHFEPVEHFGGKKYLEYIQKRDKIKNDYCHQNNIRLIRIRYDENVEARLREDLIPLLESH